MSRQKKRAKFSRVGVICGRDLLVSYQLWTCAAPQHQLVRAARPRSPAFPASLASVRVSCVLRYDMCLLCAHAPRATMASPRRREHSPRSAIPLGSYIRPSGANREMHMPTNIHPYVGQITHRHCTTMPWPAMSLCGCPEGRTLSQTVPRACSLLNRPLEGSRPALGARFETL